jgi:hypothetical protein
LVLEIVTDAQGPDQAESSVTGCLVSSAVDRDGSPDQASGSDEGKSGTSLAAPEPQVFDVSESMAAE